MKLSINGKEVTASPDVDANMPLLWFIRDLQNLKGTKFGCGKGLCGSCTVVMDGAPVRSCSVPLSAAANSKITTIEGLSADESHPVQKAWAKHNVPQCGYCQPGQIMNAVGTLQANPKITMNALIEAMSGNICRCGTYSRIVAALADAKKEMTGG